MLQFINGIEAEAWAGIAGLTAGIVSAIFAVRKGVKKGPVEVGHTPPPTDRIEYVLKETRVANAKLSDLDSRISDIDRRTEEILLDTRILLDRRH